MPPKKATKSERRSASKNTGKTKKPKQPEQPKQPKNVTFNPNFSLGRTASDGFNKPYHRGEYRPISQITREELDELEIPFKRHPYGDNYVETPELNAYRTTTIEEANRYLGPSDPTMRSDTDAINKEKAKRLMEMSTIRNIRDRNAEEERLREEQGSTDSAMTGSTLTPEQLAEAGLEPPIGRNPGGYWGGKRRTKKSRKSRKVRKVRKARKSRKSRKAKGG